MADVTGQKRQEERLTYLAGLLDNTEDAVVAMDERYFLIVWNKGAARLYGWRAEEVVGRHANEVARTNLSEEERTELRRDLAANGRWRGEVIVLRKDGTTVEAELISVALRGEQQSDITGYLTIHRDICARRKRCERHSGAARRSWRASPTRSSRWTTSGTTPTSTTAPCRACATGRAPRSRVRTSLAGHVGDVPEAIGTEVHRQYQQAMRERRAVAFETYFAPSGEWIEAHAYPSGSGLSVYYRDVHARRRAEEALREAREQRAIADHRLEDVREAERSRIARDLHDEVLQGLTHALAVTGRHAPSRDDELYAILQQVGRQLRAAIYGLRLERNGERTFSEALRELVELNRELTPACEAVLEIDDDLPNTAFGARGTEVLRIIGEALANASRHAAADRIVVRVTGPETRLSVAVTDDGRGFALSRQRPALHGQGLRGMYERAELLDAHLDIRRDQTGTTVLLQVDLSPA